MSALKGEVTIREPTRGQQGIARRVAEARATIPDVTVDADLEMDAATRLGRAWGVDPADFILGACARALREFPTVNGA
jgi:pyruvate dehydrogenase E2 component (dihydrolipoamide acetyltransferase)